MRVLWREDPLGRKEVWEGQLRAEGMGELARGRWAGGGLTARREVRVVSWGETAGMAGQGRSWSTRGVYLVSGPPQAAAVLWTAA